MKCWIVVIWPKTSVSWFQKEMKRKEKKTLKEWRQKNVFRVSILLGFGSWIVLYLHSNRCSSPQQRCVRVWQGSVRPQMGAVPRGSPALRAACCKLGARRRQVGRPGEEPRHYWPRAETLPEAYTPPPPTGNTETNSSSLFIDMIQRYTQDTKENGLWSRFLLPCYCLGADRIS